MRNQVKRGLLRVVHEVKSAGEDFELDSRLQDDFGEIGLTYDQIELVKILAPGSSTAWKTRNVCMVQADRNQQTVAPFPVGAGGGI